VLGDNVVITVLEINNGIVKLGIEAPHEIIVYREEIYEKIKKKLHSESNNAHLSSFSMPKNDGHEE